MPTTTTRPPKRRAASRATTKAGLRCPVCGATTFRTTEHLLAEGVRGVQLHCAGCAALVRVLADYDYHPAGPIANPKNQTGMPTEQWIGLVKTADADWVPVALAETPGRCWEALELFPWQLDKLLIPTLATKTRRPAERDEGAP